jgi:hypothetical protein
VFQRANYGGSAKGGMESSIEPSGLSGGMSGGRAFSSVFFMRTECFTSDVVLTVDDFTFRGALNELGLPTSETPNQPIGAGRG